MIGALAAGRKATKYGYKAYGIPGAVAAGAGGVAAAGVAKKGIEVAVEADAEPIDAGSETRIDVEEESDGADETTE